MTHEAHCKNEDVSAGIVHGQLAKYREMFSWKAERVQFVEIDIVCIEQNILFNIVALYTERRRQDDGRGYLNACAPTARLVVNRQ